MKTTTKELFMKITQEEINSVNLRAGRFDMTQIPRLRTDFTEADGIPNFEALNAINERANANSEAVEDLWIELDCQLIDAIEAEKERKAKRKVNYLKREVIELCRKGYMASEIHSITRASLVDIAKWTKKITLEDTLLEDCPEDIRNDLLSEFE
jgi:hypothetical protein|tara:strand:+ start:149 stop:610 length:462 start_codon:yes stop_codon:yes gene_type:complete